MYRYLLPIVLLGITATSCSQQYQCTCTKEDPQTGQSSFYASKKVGDELERADRECQALQEKHSSYGDRVYCNINYL